jgi:anti-anti-sigma factor
MPSIRIERGDDRSSIIVIPLGELDLAFAPRLAEALEEVLAAYGSVVLDLGEVDFIDSSIISVITTASRDVARREAGTQLVVVSPPGSHPRRVLDMVGADAFVRLFDDRSSAVASIGW